jgi:Amt family ammonium transporter
MLPTHSDGEPILLGIFASKAVNPAGADGLLNGDIAFFLKETVAVLGASVYAFVVSYVMLVIIDQITPVKLTEKEEADGLDSALHGEQAYFE